MQCHFIQRTKYVLEYVHIVNQLRERPILRTDLQMRTTFGFGWVGGFRKTRCSDFQ